MNLRSEFAWVRAAGLISVLSLVACDSGSADTKADAKKAEPVKAPVEAKVVEPVKTPTPTPTPTPTDVKAADTAGDTKSADAADPSKAGDTKAADPTKAGDTKAADTKTAGLDGKALYESKCKVCHGLDGKGTEAMKKNKIPDMTVAEWQSKHDNAVINKAITDGIDGTKMKAFKGKLKPEEIEAITVYVKTLK